jgi:putative Ca2+/H+ antiporter (TMEM165/GDT1 family)
MVNGLMLAFLPAETPVKFIKKRLFILFVFSLAVEDKKSQNRKGQPWQKLKAWS